MPSMAHEILVDLFKNRPQLAAEILVEVLGFPLPDYTEARITSADLTEIQPAEYRADIVVLLLEDGAPVRVIIVEVQLTSVPQKRWSWPAYAAVARAVHRCPVALLVVAPDPSVAAWCAEPIETGMPGFVLCPHVLPRTAVPVVTDPEEAARRPELGVLSAMAHGDTEQGATIASAVLPVLRGLDDDRARLYYDLVYTSMNEAARRALETMMKGYEYQSDFARKYVAQGRAEGLNEGLSQGLNKGRAEGLNEGLSQGLNKGRAEGLNEGFTKGRTEEAARALLTVLQARGLAVPETLRERILAQKDPERLERWLERAAVATSAAAILDESN
jgi:hypothetical protein